MTSILAVGRDINDPTSPLTCADGAATGAMALGGYRYKCTFRTFFGETLASPASALVTTTKGSVDLSNIPVYPGNEVTARRIYRTTVGGAGSYLFLAEIADNITTTYTDLKNDAALGAAEPTANFASTVERVEGWMQFNRQVGRSQGSITAAGLTQPTATLIGNYEYVYVAVPVNLSGVRLPPINTNLIGVKVTINNTDMVNTLNVYPYELTTSINGGVPGAPLAVAASFSLELICNGAASWRFASSLTAGVAGPPSGAAGGDLTGTYPAPALITTGVAAGTYGSTTQIPVITFDTKGRALLAANAIADKTPGGLVPGGGDLTGLYPAPTLTTTGVVAGSYGSGTFVPVIAVDAKGRITSASSTLITAIASGPAGGDLTGSYPNPSLSVSGVVAGTYGSVSNTPVIAVDAKGRITSATTVVTAAIPGGPAGGDLAGSYPNPTLGATGVVAGSYGTAALIPVVTVDAKGRITTISTAAVAGGPPTGAAGGSLGGTYPNPTLSATGVALGTYTKVTVNLEGRITSGTTLVSTDIPSAAGDVTGAYTSTVVSSIRGINTKGSSVDKILLISDNTTCVGVNVTAMGKGALLVNTGGTHNSALGADALAANVSGVSNCAFGSQALMANVTGGGNSAFGKDSLAANTGDNNSAFGLNSLLANASGTRNSAFGKDSAKTSSAANDISAFGFSALSAATGGSNSAFGSNAGLTVSTGTGNVLCGSNVAGSLTTGNNNTVVGNAAGGANLNTGSNNLVLGNGASPSAAAVSNEITLGNSSITRVRFATHTVLPVYANNAAAVGGGLTSGMLYRTGADPDVVCIVH